VLVTQASGTGFLERFIPVMSSNSIGGSFRYDMVTGLDAEAAKARDYLYDFDFFDLHL
jgi:hypothetical protein